MDKSQSETEMETLERERFWMNWRIPIDPIPLQPPMRFDSPSLMTDTTPKSPSGLVLKR